MSGEGIFVDLSQPRPFSGGRTLRNCKNKGEKDKIIEIDAGSNNCRKVIVIDVPDSLPKRVRSYSVSDPIKNEATIICIDDDDDNTEHLSLDKVQFVQPNKNPVNISKCKRTYSGASTSGNPYGPYTYSENALSGNNGDDGTDFVLEGSAGKIKEEWEKAFLKRQNNVLADDDQNGTGKMIHEPYSSPKTKKDVFNSPTGTNADAGYFGRESYQATDELESRQRELWIQAEEPAAKRREKEEATAKRREKEAAAAKIREREAAAKRREKEAAAAKIRENEEAAAKIREKEEAHQLQLLQKRKMAESSRLLDMEKRQKQRVDEMRESQKKDEDNLNLKEKLRTEVRKELNKLETTCHDMASILRGLNVSLNGGTTNEVRIAFKRSLLSFHPDRASQSDIRQQVEAEEKFKFINRMKEKFSFTT